MDNNENKEEIISSSDNFSFIRKNGKVGIKPNFLNVVIMPFTKDSQGLPFLVGVIEESNPFREGGIDINLVTGTTEDEDPDLLSTAKRELLEETGFDVEENERWFYLGNSTSSKFVDHEQPCFAVDITDLVREESKEGEDEKISRFKFIPANDVVKAKNIFIPGIFLKLFKYVMGLDLSGQPKKKDNKGFNFTL